MLDRIELELENINTVDGKIPADLLTGRIDTISVHESPELVNIDNLPDGISNIYLSNCTSLSSIATLPASTIRLSIENCNNVNAIAKMPENLMAFALFGNLGDALPMSDMSYLPANLQDLYVRGCPKFESLPGLSNNIRVLDFKGCANLRFSESDSLPTNLRHFKLKECTATEILPPLPDGLESLNLKGCSNLRSLPPLPINLRRLNLDGCNNLVITDDLLLELTLLKDNGCVITYNAAALQRLVERDGYEFDGEYIENAEGVETIEHPAITKLKSKLAPLSSANPYTVGLLTKYLEKDHEYRGGITQIINDATPVIDFITDNPQHQKWAEKVSLYYREGCINQPVSGFAEICAWKRVAEAEDMESKINATDQLLAHDIVTKIVGRNSPGEAVEVEAGNILLREVHKKLVAEDGMIPWTGIPEEITYEGIIRSWLTPDILDSAYKAVKEITSKPPIEKLDYLSRSYNMLPIWAAVAFPTETTAIERKYEGLKGDLLELSANEEPIPEHLLKYLSEDVDKVTVTSDDRLRLLGSIYDVLSEFKMAREIITTTHGLSLASIAAKEKDAEEHGSSETKAGMTEPSKTVVTISNTISDFESKNPVEEKEHKWMPATNPPLVRSRSTGENDTPPTIPPLNRGRSTV